MTQTNFQNTFIFVILGDIPTKVDHDSPCHKYVNYGLFSNAVIITLLAQKHGIPADHIVVFGYGQPADYNMSVIPTKRVFYQLNVDEIYKSNDSTSVELNLQYYTDLTQIKEYFESYISDTNIQPDLFIFLDDHGTNYFGKFPFLDFYLVFLTCKANSLNIFVDCCESSSFIDICQLFHSLKNQFDRIIKDSSSRVGVFPMVRLISNILPSLSRFQGNQSFKIIFSNLLPFFQKMLSIPLTKQVEILNAIDFVHQRILAIYPKLFSHIDHERAEILNLPFNEEFCQRHVRQLINPPHQTFLLQYFSTIGDVFDIGYLFSALAEDSFDSLSMFSQLFLSVSLLIQTQEALELDTSSFLDRLRSFLSTRTFLSTLFELPIPSSYFLCTTSHPRQSVPTFGTRRLDQSTKIIMGSPGMSAFIQEVFIFPHPNGISLSRLQEMAPGHYAVFSSNKKKQWLSLEFQSFGSCASLDFKPFTDTNGRPLTTQEIMRLINFDLAVKFQEKDHETPINPDFPGAPEKGEDAKHYQARLQKYCQDTFEFQIATNAKRDKRKRYCPPQTESLPDDEEYYSDDNVAPQPHVKQVHLISKKDTLFSFKWNQEIPQDKLDSLPIHIYLSPSNPYFSLRDVFFAVFQQVKTDDIVIDINDNTVSDSQLYFTIYDWLKCFLPADYIVPYVVPFAYPMISYITKSTTPLSEIQEWFFCSLNIADQYVMSKLFHKKTFIPGRLNNPIVLPPITNRYLIAIYETGRKS